MTTGSSPAAPTSAGLMPAGPGASPSVHGTPPLDPDWRRPGPDAAGRRRDALIALLLVLASGPLVAIMSSMGTYEDRGGNWSDVLVTAGMAACLVVRRRFPLTTLAVGSAAFIVLSYGSPASAHGLIYQAAYFSVIYTAVAWAPDRRVLWIEVVLVVLVMAAWVVLAWTVFGSYQRLVGGSAQQEAGPLDPATGWALYTAVINAAYFGGAVAFGIASWRAAQRREKLQEQAQLIQAQARLLARQEVVQERLRLARELHDSVGHHFTGVGVLAGGARRMVESAACAEPAASGESAEGGLHLDAARTRRLRESLAGAEEATRDGLQELRAVLGVLRVPAASTVDTPAGPEGPQNSEANPRGNSQDTPEDPDGFAGSDLSASPSAPPEEDEESGAGLAGLEDLAAGMSRFGVAVRREVVGIEPAGWERIVQDMPTGHQLAVYRMVQEAFSNVVRHSGARQAALALRVLPHPPALEAEITDEGRGVGAVPVDGSAPGAGSGLRGMAERCRLLGGSVEWGPRATGTGWFVRFRLPLPTELLEEGP